MPEQRAAVTALTDVYTALAGLVTALPEEDGWRETALPGWGVRDLIVHMLGDAERALVAFGTPSPDPADRDEVTYWTDFPPAASRRLTIERRNRQIRVIRSLATAYPWEVLVETYAETTAAVTVLGARADPEELISTQGHTLTVDDLLSTLTLEATVHHLDLISGLDRPGPPESGLAVVRRCLDGLLGRPEPIGWDDATYALKGTGRRPLSTAEAQKLGDASGRFPLLA